MNTYYSLFIFFLVQIALKYSKAAVTVDTVCKNGHLAQMSNHFKCICNEGLVHLSEDTCEEKNECKEETLDKTCGEFGKCIKITEEEQESTYKCECIEGYTLKEGDCVLDVCENKDCGESGECIVGYLTEVQSAGCSCAIGKVPNPEDEQKCTKTGETACQLKCNTDNEVCKNVEGIYKCQCMEGFNFDKEKNECLSYSVFNILNLSLFFIILVVLSYVI
uniref:Ookinete surface proteins P25 n=1 Tax=Plasmodium cynomolgi TaxID=5827 RepID=A0A1B0WVZ2_9APIC|nr:ookinete surface proteins P25 [Plasmodium cynomolgi]